MLNVLPSNCFYTVRHFAHEVLLVLLSFSLYMPCLIMFFLSFFLYDAAFAPMNMENNFGQHDSRFRNRHDSNYAPRNMENKFGSNNSDFGTQSGRSFRHDPSFRNQHGLNFQNESSFRNHQYPNFQNQRDPRNRVMSSEDQELMSSDDQEF